MLNSLDCLDSCNDWLLFILARFQFPLQIYSAIYIGIYSIKCACSYMLPIELPNGFFQLTSSILLLATLQRPQFPNISVDLFTLLTHTDTQVHVCIQIFTYVCANFSVRFVISWSLSGGRSVPIATLFVRARADLQAPSRGRCTWASSCCCRHCRCCGCIGKPDQAPCTYRGNGPGCHKLQTCFATRLFW